MAAHKPRTPGSIEDAVTRIMGLCGVPACAKAVGKSEATIYGWSNPDIDSTPNAEHVHKLDILALTTAGETPLFEVHLSRIESVECVEHEAHLPLHRIHYVSAMLGHLTEALLDARRPDGPGGNAITPNEMSQILDKIRELQLLLDKLQKDVIEASNVVKIRVAGEVSAA